MSADKQEFARPHDRKSDKRLDLYATPGEIREIAEAWFNRQCKVIALAMGAEKWAEHREWVEDYLRAEIRERLVARGWRPK